MKEQKKRKYEASEMKEIQVESEDGICAVSHTGKSVADGENGKVNVSE